jgi:hypothetical protein
MARGICWYLACFGVLGVLGVLAGCSGGSYFAEREPWRHQAEAQCLDSGAVKEGAGRVRIKAINGPGMCGADFPIKVSALGDSASVLSYSDELRPPGAIPNRPGATPLRWPGVPVPPTPAYEDTYESLPTSRSIQSRPLPPPAVPRYETQSRYEVQPHYEVQPRYETPLSLDPPPTAGRSGPTYQPYDFRKPFGEEGASPVRSSAGSLDPNSPAYDLSPEPYDRRRVIDEDRRPGRYNRPPTLRVPVRESQPEFPLGPSRGPPVTGAITPVAVSPAATLACPIVSALDQWIAGSVQPAAMQWFGQPVVEIKQISAYSCRGMNGNPRARISEHAFGNALDIAAFTLADGRKITVKNGWRGTPEEQGFLRDVQGAACEQFNTVLAPGSNVYHYDHIHVDLMRRSGGRRACNPDAVSGEEVAARARARYAKRGEPSVTGSISSRRSSMPKKQFAPSAYADGRWDGRLPIAEPGDDGED